MARRTWVAYFLSQEGREEYVYPFFLLVATPIFIKGLHIWASHLTKPEHFETGPLGAKAF
jgi:hypothetical protein